MTRPESYVDASKVGTWFDPEMYPHAMVMHLMWEAWYFALDHTNQTARFLRTVPREAVQSSMFGSWTLAEVEPWKVDREPSQLPGLELRLMSFPWNGTATYTIEREMR